MYASSLVYVLVSKVPEKTGEAENLVRSIVLGNSLDSSAFIFLFRMESVKFAWLDSVYQKTTKIASFAVGHFQRSKRRFKSGFFI